MSYPKKVIIIAAIFVSVLGMLFHFIYDWSGQNTFVGLFAPVNESIWEHMKLLFFPMLITGGFVCYLLREQLPGLSSSFPAGLLTGIWLIPVFFYSYRGILGFGWPAVDISTFYLSVILAFFIVYRCAGNDRLSHWKWVLIALIILTAAGFFWFTYDPPSLGIFINLG